MDKLNFPDFLEKLGLEFQARLERSGFYQHPTGVGDAREDLVHDYLKSLLPLRFAVDKGKIFDKDGHLSREFDVIISESSELVPAMTLAGRRIVPIEAVYGIIEIKSVLDQKAYDRFIEAVEELDSMKRFYEPVGLSFTEDEKKRIADGLSPQTQFRFVGRIWSGMIAFDGVGGKTIADYLCNSCEGFGFICIPGRELVMPWSKTNGFAGVAYKNKSFPIALWLIMELLTRSVRPNFFKPNFSYYRESIIKAIGEVPGSWTSSHERIQPS